MTGGTHVAVGIACSLGILQPKTISGCLCALAGSILGSSISDIDINNIYEKILLALQFHKIEDGWKDAIRIVFSFVVLMTIDFYAGNGAIAYITNNPGLPLFTGFGVFLSLCIFGVTTKHRTFLHSILVGFGLTASLWLCCRPIAIPFAIGFISHIILDLFNKKEIQFFWPIPGKFALKLCASNGKVNDIIGALGKISTVYLTAWYGIHAFGISTIDDVMLSFFNTEISIWNIHVTVFTVYMIIINIITFVLFAINYKVWNNGDFWKNGFFFALVVAGGMIGELLAVFIFEKGKLLKGKDNENFHLYIIPICVLSVWIFMAYTFYYSPVHDEAILLSKITVATIPLTYIIICYFILLNLITVFVLLKSQQFASKLTTREKIGVSLCFFGGATGGFLSTKCSGKHCNARFLSATIFWGMIMHAILLTCMFYDMPL